jgi:hypothetical protein
MIKPLTCIELQRAALKPPTVQGFRANFAYELIAALRNKDNPAAEATLRHLIQYLYHLETGLPCVLNALADIGKWRIGALLNRSTGTMRKPKIYLSAEFSGRKTLSIRRGLVQTSNVGDKSHRPMGWLEDTVFIENVPTWCSTGAPSDTIIRLKESEYPSYPQYLHSDEDRFLAEENTQRKLFIAFLKSYVEFLSVSLDIEILDWVDFDDQNRLYITTPQERTVALAKKQYLSAKEEVAIAKVEAEVSIARIEIDFDTFEKTMAHSHPTGAKLQELFQSVIGRKIHLTQLNACARVFGRYCEWLQTLNESTNILMEAESLAFRYLALVPGRRND